MGSDCSRRMSMAGWISDRIASIRACGVACRHAPPAARTPTAGSAMILVAGGSGFLGSAVVRRLVREGADVAVMTAHPGRSRARIESLGARPVAGDVLDPGSLDAA